jgi:hypothetical protein
MPEFISPCGPVRAEPGCIPPGLAEIHTIYCIEVTAADALLAGYGKPDTFFD